MAKSEAIGDVLDASGGNASDSLVAPCVEVVSVFTHQLAAEKSERQVKLVHREVAVAAAVESVKPGVSEDIEAVGQNAQREDWYAQRTIEPLLAGLSSWSPAVRLRSSVALSRREGDFLPQHLELLDGNDRNGRYGA